MKTALALLTLCIAVANAADAPAPSQPEPRQDWSIDRLWGYVEKLETENRINRKELGRLHRENRFLSDVNNRLSERSLPSAERPAPQSPAKGKWRVVARFNGNGKQITAPFTIIGKEWRIRWRASRTDSIGCFFAVTARMGEDDKLLVNTNRPGEELSYGRGVGRGNLDVDAIFAAWEIDVEELR